MEGDFPQGDKAQYKPAEYKQLTYAPKQKLQDEAELAKTKKTSLEREYSLWALIREQSFHKKKQEGFDPAELQEITSFGTVQDFWMVYQHMRRPTAMPYGTNLHVFVKGIKPVWEDAQLQEGARFTLKMPKSHCSKYWEDLLLAMIGEQMPEGLVAGVVLNLKPQFDKIAVWITDCNDEKKIAQLKADILKVTQIEEKEIEYEIFKEVRDKKPVK
jgi:translation initiation factor 4E